MTDGPVRRAVRGLLEALEECHGLDLNDPNFHDTPDRVARAYGELLAGAGDTDARAAGILSKSFPCERDGMVIIEGIRVFSMCPHHLLPVDYEVTAAYIPDRDNGRVVGLSKIPRLIELLARRPVLQERFVGDVVDWLMRIPGCRGAACFVRGAHHCMRMRGASQTESVTITSSMRGVFETDGVARYEFLRLVGRKD